MTCLPFRVITDTIRNCYAALGVIHQVWRPVPAGSRITSPCPGPNLYQSLHTTVIHSGQTVRGADSHKRNASHRRNRVVAAHWRIYKDGKGRLRCRRSTHIMDEAINRMGKGNARAVGIYVHAQGGPLPRRGLCVHPERKGARAPARRHAGDFAYAVHTEVGNQCIGAKVNGQIVPLRHRLTNGDVVEILTQKGHVPSRGLAELCAHFTRAEQGPPSHQLHRAKARRRKSAAACSSGKSGKRGAVDEENSGSRLAPRGFRIRMREARRPVRRFGIREIFRAANPFERAGRASRGKNRGQAEEAPARLVSTVKRMLRVGEATLQVGGHDDLMVFRAKCCNPIPGDDIIGYVTRGCRGCVCSNPYR